ncbi:hypothetical protein BDR26DRAFT_379765 [Obelidium mucronatum]|nr:hypothetical protein BDR26DRAFT_379765 [Obelidium mucronatum]
MTHFTSPQHLTLFKEAIHFVFVRWTALQLAIEHSMGGSSTLAKVSMLGDYILDFFTEHGLRIDPTDLEENVVEFFGESFQVELEDGSGAEISKMLCDLFAQLGRGDLSGFERVRELASRVVPLGPSRKVVGDDDDDDDDSDSSDDDDILDYSRGQQDDMDMDDASSIASPAPKPEPIIDEDGFELVQQKGRRRR